ncbi:microcin C ABC transporter permease YejB [Paralimibaculum aggregatum]|uniref:Microcin C ABC transporter permease YejB n=1 Tax=Paralimibaculum aggregatum TaxID=3036245 RepID=A0ABQ6LII8_9RHOB|nr:microcin C ABC transporter permease YejB [Limibaculum sp. NKW23]GMG80983.1 microcin C ABC transporter permease YejB [Limibaculum sp. NKW23]
MGAYILRRLLLILPTLLGIMLLNFALIQFAPGGPVEQILSQVEEGAHGGGATARFAGGTDAGGGGPGDAGGYRGAQGLDPELIARLEVQFGFARIVCAEGHDGPVSVEEPACEKQPIPVWERFVIMLGNYATFDFGESFYHSKTVIQLIGEKLPVSITLGLWTTFIAYIVSIPLGIAKAVRDGSRFDAITSAIVIAAYAIPGFLFAVLLLVVFAGGEFFQLFPLRGLHSDEAAQMGWWDYILDYLWHIVLPVSALVISAFATLTLLTKNSFLDEIRKQYVVTARAKGLSQSRVLYGHVFRNAMLIVISGFPAAFIAAFFQGALFVETVYSLDGLGLLGFESVVNRDYPVVMGTLFIFGLIGLVVKLISDLTYVAIDPRIDFEARG